MTITSGSPGLYTFGRMHIGYFYMDFKLTSPNNDTFQFKFSNMTKYSTNLVQFGHVYYYNMDNSNVADYTVVATSGGYRLGKNGQSLRGNQIATSSTTVVSMSAEVLYIQN